MKVKVRRGPETEKNIQKCYGILIKHIKLEAKEAGLTIEEYWCQLEKKQVI
ncbi:hypothetical protein [Neobacillus piezotolerans]|uniref:hypothetical protein n=1 Tax=Neobacillus piezotolerans TaxID=2259171 RepID=UPI0015F1AABE|nr:hypothetical protein [Neobacillus piezotolerans]